MNAAELSVIIKLVDQASRDLGDVKSAIKGLGDESLAAGRKTDQATSLIDKGFANAKTAAIGFGTAMAAALVTDQLVSFAKSSVSAASDMQESLSKTEAVFKTNAGEVESWADTSATAFGQSTQQALEAASTLGNLFTAMDVTGDAAAEMSMDLVELASDLASFNNLGTDEALEKLRAGLVGEVEPLRTLGVQLSAAAVEAKALELGLADTADQLTSQDKVMARYKLILEQTSTAAGDFQRTSDGLANQQRILDANVENLQATIGEGLLPVVLEVTAASNDMMDSPLFQGGVQLASTQLGELTATAGTFRDVMDGAAGPLGDVVGWVDQLGPVSDAASASMGALTVALPGVGLLHTVNQGFSDGKEALQEFGLVAEDAGTAWSDFNLNLVDNGLDAAGVDIDEFIQKVKDAAIELGGGEGSTPEAQKDYIEATKEAIVVTDRATEVDRMRIGVLEDAKIATIEEAEAQMSRNRALGKAVEEAARYTIEGHRYTQVVKENIVALDHQALAANQLSMAQAGLAETYQLAGANAEIFNAQGSEYSAIASDLTSAYDVLNERKKEGIELTDEEIRFLENYEVNLGRVEGGMDDAAVQAGLYRQAQVDLMQAQDALSEAIRNGTEDLTPYQDAVDDAEQSLRDADEASGGMKSANDILIDAIITQLIPTLQDLQGILDKLSETDPEIEISANTQNAINAVEGFKQYLRDNPATIDLYVNQPNVIGFTQYEPNGSGMSSQTSLQQSGGWTSQAAFTKMGEDAGMSFGTGFGGGFTKVTENSPVIRDAGKEAGRNYGEDFEGEFLVVWDEMWDQASQSVARTFENDIASIMDGSAAQAALDGAAAAQAFMDAWVEAGFSTDAPAYIAAQERYDEAMDTYAIIAEIAGTEAAEAFWDSWMESQREWQWPEQAAWDAAENIWRSPGWEEGGIKAGINFSDAFAWQVREGFKNLPGEIIAEPDVTAGWIMAGQEHAGLYMDAFNEAVTPTMEDQLDALNGDPTTTDTGPSGGGGGGPSGGSPVGFLAGSVIIPESVFGPGPYDSGFLYEQSLAQNPNSRQNQQPVNIYISGRAVTSSALQYLGSGAPAGWAVGE